MRLSTTSSATLATSGWDSASSSLFSSSQDISRSSSMKTPAPSFQIRVSPSRTLFFMPWESPWYSRSNFKLIEIKIQPNLFQGLMSGIFHTCPSNLREGINNKMTPHPPLMETFHQNQKIFFCYLFMPPLSLQFDTTVMYVIISLVFVKIYQFR